MIERRKKAILLTILIFLLIFSLYILKDNFFSRDSVLASDLSLKASQEHNGAISLDSVFSLESKKDLDSKLISKKLKVEPEMTFEIKKEKNNRLSLIPKEELRPDELYHFSLENDQGDFSWTFQTEKSLKVLETLPHDKATDVPKNSGIEIVFNQGNLTKIKDFFVIEPKADGQLIFENKTLKLIPKKLEPETLYTVSLKKGLPIADSDLKLKEDFSFQFESSQAEKDEGHYWELYPNSLEFMTSEKPLLTFTYFSQALGEIKESKISLFQFRNYQEFLNYYQEREKIPHWTNFAQDNFLLDTGKLNKIKDLKLAIGESRNINYCEFPEKLPAGYYLAEMEIAGLKRQALIQISDISAYAIFDKENSLFWVNDLQKKSPLGDAKITLLNSKETARTNTDGLAHIKLKNMPKKNSDYMALLEKNNEKVLVSLKNDSNSFFYDSYEPSYVNKFWRYLYLDRSIYQANDRVYFWGFLKERKPDTPLEKELSLKLEKEKSWNDSALILEKTIPLKDNSFTGDLELNNLETGNYSLSVFHDDELVLKDFFEIASYSKPAYRINIAKNKKAIFSDETVDFLVNTEFYEGSLAGNIALNYNIANQNGKIQTNASGLSKISYQPEFQENNYFFDQHSLYLFTDLPESGEISKWDSVIVLQNDIDMEIKAKVEKDYLILDILANKLTVDRVNKEKIDLYDKNNFIEDVAKNLDLEIYIYEEIWQKEKIGEYYDFIEKKKKEQFSYSLTKKLIKKDGAKTNAQGKLNYEYKLPKKTSYSVELVAKDRRGKVLRRSANVNNGFQRDDSSYLYYNLENKEENYKYSLGDKVELEFRENERQLEDRKRSFLYLELQEGLRDWGLSDKSSYQMTFKKEMLPNYFLKGVYFDGRYYHPTGDCLLNYREKDREIKIDLELDKESYLPGEKAKLKIKLSNKDGQPVQAKVNISLVDEALFALRNQHVDILSSFYNDLLYTGVLKDFYTHAAPKLSNLAEHGGEGAAERSDFKDTVYFATLESNREGLVESEIELPDNLTAWRLTLQAVTRDLEAGTRTESIKVKKDFFLDPVLSSHYLAGDKFRLPVRVFGDSLESDSAVDFKFTLYEKDKLIFQEDLKKERKKSFYLDLPKLSEGKYSLHLEAQLSDKIKDSLELPLEIKNKNILKKKVKLIEVGEKIESLASQENIEVTVLDKFSALYLENLKKLSHTDSSRIELRLAKDRAEKQLAEVSAEEVKERNRDFLNYQQKDGGIGLLAYSDSNLRASSLIALLDSNQFDQESLKTYFTAILNKPEESRERKVQALLGLASFQEKVLDEINYLLEKEKLSKLEKSYLGLALLELKDRQRAKDLFTEIMASSLEDLSGSARIKGKNPEESLQLTGLMTVAAFDLNLEAKDKLLEYMTQTESKKEVYALEILLALEKGQKNFQPEETSFSYTLEGKEEKISLKNQEKYQMVLSPKALEKISFKNLKGEHSLLLEYQELEKPEANLSMEGAKISRTYSALKKEGEDFQAQDVIKIQLDYELAQDREKSSYEIVDYLPQGLKIIPQPYFYGLELGKNQAYPLNIQEERVVFLVDGEKKSGSIYYYARVVNPGEFSANPSLLRDALDGRIYASSAEARLKINE